MVQQQIKSDKKLAEMLSLESDEENDLISIDGIQTTKSKSLCEALQKLSVKTQPESGNGINVFVQRQHALKNALEDLKSSKMETSKLCVEFVGESAVDTGGPTRELFSIAFQQAEDSKITRGSLPNITFMHDQSALANGDYTTFGQFVALSFLNGAGGPHIFSPSLARFILGIKETSTSLEDVINELPGDQVVIKDKLKSLNACTNSDDWASKFLTFDQRFDMGINKPTVPFQEKDEVIRGAVKQIMITSALEEIYSFLDGLSLFGVFSVLKEHPEDAYKELTYVELTVEDVRKPFIPTFSIKGSSRRVKEELIIYNYNQFLKKCYCDQVSRTTVDLDSIFGEELVNAEETTKKITLHDVFQFITGSRHQPPGNLKGKVAFKHDALHGERCKSNTCGNIITFPVNDRYASEDSDIFTSNFADDIFDGPGYGNI